MELVDTGYVADVSETFVLVSKEIEQVHPFEAMSEDI
jgi:hypothetical protein